jgi:enamine deaminase RidA (YjgF/YER057c/UK114 family)
MSFLKRSSTSLALGMAIGLSALSAEAADIVRTPIPGSDFPISQSVLIPAGAETLIVSGMIAKPAKPDAPKGSAEYWGDTEAQSASVLGQLEEALKAKGYSMNDVVSMQAFLVGDPAKEGKLDFAGFMKAYVKFFATPANPNKPARYALQIAALAAPGALIEIAVTAAKVK